MSPLTIPKPEDRAEWLAARHPYFNASDAAVLFDCHPFRTAADVAAAKLAPLPIDNGPTEAMDRGNRLEPVLLDWFSHRCGVQIITPEVLYTNGSVMATLDGEPVGDADWFVEAKTTAQRWDEVPEHVYWQVVAQAYATGRSRCEVVWIDADMKFKHRTLQPNAEAIETFAAKATEFMEWISLGMVPEGVELTNEHAAAMYPVSEAGKSVEVDPDAKAVLADLIATEAQRKQLEAHEARLKGELQLMLGEAEVGLLHGHEVMTWRTQRRSSIDTKAIEREEPELAARFERTTSYRVFRLAKGVRDV